MSKNIYITALSKPVFKIVAKASSMLNMDSYVIGGYVRDFILFRSNSKDIDIVTVGSGIDLAKKVSNLIPERPKVFVFKNYGTAMLKTDEIEIEFVGARKESYQKTSRNPAVEEGTLEDDQNRRDFSINAVALSLNEHNFGELLDPFNGINDLKNKIIRTPLDPDITYSDDPLRMLRAIRFATQLQFRIEDQSFKSIEKNAKRINIISTERIVDELHKILASPKPSIGFAILNKVNLLTHILPELSNFVNGLNVAADGFFRRALFAYELDRSFRRAGIKEGFKGVMLDGKSIPAEFLEKAGAETLKGTFSYSFKKGRGSGESVPAAFVDFIETVPFGTVLVPFARFTANSIAFQYQYSPLNTAMGAMNMVATATANLGRKEKKKLDIF